MRTEEVEINEILWEAEIFLKYEAPQDGLMIR